MTWNYRIVFKDDGYAIHEVYYDSEGEPTACTVQAVSPFGETVMELRQDARAYMTALGRPVLKYDEIEWNGT